MALFLPGDREVLWDTSYLLELVKGYGVVFGTNSPYEAYLTALVSQQLATFKLLGAGCSEKEVEDLVTAAELPVILLLVDSISSDAGAALVGRIRQRQAGTKMILLVNNLSSYGRNPGLASLFDGLVSAGNVGRGGIYRCLEAILKQGHSYVDPLLQLDLASSECPQLGCLSHRERSILPLLARGLKNKQIASELSIAESTTRDYVSSILAKLQINNRAAAAAWAIGQGLVGD
ncbi:MAG: LuxR C-terminal-related transcriptional regulator [Cyanobacteria bacterium]|nr:LuxR C-terminal-related transcriptional regulator [Cyanobacteriota bacterium]